MAEQQRQRQPQRQPPQPQPGARARAAQPAAPRGPPGNRGARDAARTAPLRARVRQIVQRALEAVNSGSRYGVAAVTPATDNVALSRLVLKHSGVPLLLRGARVMTAVGRELRLQPPGADVGPLLEAAQWQPGSAADAAAAAAAALLLHEPGGSDDGGDDDDDSDEGEGGDAGYATSAVAAATAVGGASGDDDATRARRRLHSRAVAAAQWAAACGFPDGRWWEAGLPAHRRGGAITAHDAAWVALHAHDLLLAEKRRVAFKVEAAAVGISQQASAVVADSFGGGGLVVQCLVPPSEGAAADGRGATDEGAAPAVDPLTAAFRRYLADSWRARLQRLQQQAPGAGGGARDGGFHG